ncbi:MAG: hypothetical protein FWC15_06835 [Fibromonadales bacterium]|nr:hypothetical protein [Fibromonadales bacterium]
MKKIILSSILVTILAVAVASIILLYFKNKHDSEQQSSGEPDTYYESDGCPDCGCPDCGDGYEEYEEKTLYNYHSEIVIDDENIGHAASFASEFFVYAPFPIIKGGYISVSINYGDRADIENFVNIRDNGYGRLFMTFFSDLYKNRAEYLSNGKLLRYAKLLAGMIPRETYIANGWDVMVHQLLTAYDDLAESPSSFSDVYTIMTGDNFHFLHNAEKFPFINDKYLDVFTVKQDDVFYKAGNVNRAAIIWAYSFWGRRHNENPDSLEQIVAILRLLRDELYASP